MHPTLEGFVREYHAKGVPPPYTLLVGKDDEQNASIAGEFARKLGTEGHSFDCATIKILRDLTMLLTGNKVVFVATVQTLKREFVDRLVEALSTGDVMLLSVAPWSRCPLVGNRQWFRLCSRTIMRDGCILEGGSTKLSRNPTRLRGGLRMFPICSLPRSATPIGTLVHLPIVIFILGATLLMCEPSTTVRHIRGMRDGVSVREVITAFATRHAFGPTELHSRVERPERFPPSLGPLVSSRPVGSLLPAYTFQTSTRSKY